MLSVYYINHIALVFSVPRKCYYTLMCSQNNSAWEKSVLCMMTSSNGNIFGVTGHLCGEFPVNSPHKGQWRGALMFSLICAWINSWANNREAGDWRHHRAHYDVIVMVRWSHLTSSLSAQNTSDIECLGIISQCKSIGRYYAYFFYLEDDFFQLLKPTL